MNLKIHCVKGVFKTEIVETVNQIQHLRGPSMSCAMQGKKDWCLSILKFVILQY